MISRRTLHSLTALTALAYTGLVVLPVPQKAASGHRTIPLMPAENGSTYDIAVYLNGVRVVGLFDTGASAIVLPSAMTRGLRLYPDKQSPEISAMVASGEEIMVRQYWAQTASIGGLETRGVRVWVIDANVKPLIGQSLLSRFSYSIDNSTQTLTVSAR